MDTYCYDRDEVRNLDPKGVSYKPDGATVLAVWEDRSPCIVMNTYGKGKAILCAATDVLVGYEVDGWYKDDFLNLLSDMVRHGYDQVRTEHLSPQVELNTLVNPDRTSYAITLLNYDAKPHWESILKLKLPGQPAHIDFIPFKGKTRLLKFAQEGDTTVIRLPRFGMFCMLRIAVGE